MNRAPRDAAPSLPSGGPTVAPMEHAAAFDLSPVPQALLDDRHRVLQANRAWVAVAGDPGGRSWADLVHPEDLTRELPLIGRMQAGDLPSYTAEARLAGAAGSWHQTRITVTALSGGALVTLLPTTADAASPLAVPPLVAEERRILSAALSHDLRQHARLVTSYLSLLERAELGDKQRGQLATAMDHADRLMGGLAGLVRWVRLADTVPTLAESDLARIWLTALQSVPGAIGGEGGGDLPHIRVDPVLLGELLVAVVDNATRYARTPVSLTAERDGDAWLLLVDDGGPGIPSEARLRVLEPLRRLHSWEEVNGHGMGLAIADRIARCHGGSLRVAATPTGGCRIMARLPA